jgi:hypothetical protein
MADAVIPLIAALSAAAGLIHIGASADHAKEFALYVPAFAAIAAFQLGWAIWVAHGAPRRVLAVGIGVNLAVVAVWVMSRTIGVPIAEEAWVPEPVGTADLLATLTELLVVGATACVLLAVRSAIARRAVARLAPVLMAVLLVSVIYGVAGGHGG